MSAPGANHQVLMVARDAWKHHVLARYWLSFVAGVFVLCMLFLLIVGSLWAYDAYAADKAKLDDTSLSQSATTKAPKNSQKSIKPKSSDNLNGGVAGSAAQTFKPVDHNAPVKPCQKAQLIHAQSIPLNKAGLTRRNDAPRYYTVYGNSIEQIRAQLKACSPNGYFAATNYRMNWSYSTVSTASGKCRVADARVGIHTIVQYPNWQNSGSANASTISAWQRMMRSLVSHEEGHVSRSVQVARELQEALAAQTSVPCSHIDSVAQKLTQSYVQKLHSANSSYDHATNHGVTQGAVL